MSDADILWYIGWLWLGWFLFEAIDGFAATRALLGTMARQQRWFWSRVARPFRRSTRTA